ncbi:sensor histidine kinase KdpD [Antrihabitans sp. YC2-6]|uniref:sensor histidine kinase n=1 Tax=Antrihabitans sp. YC2-6 TaxID=2799498 RepID=UPI0018F442DC|nr:HAMP domain-containing sensor histidine kinase [Antrihabitans sp. YC2-6]MBJ8344190.1 HAMP domain-containing histidine kinase [Antrihabitans sp. YC2-6]
MIRTHSLRARVAAAAALGATIIAIGLGLLVAQVIERNNLQEIDRRLETASRLVLLNADIAVQIWSRFGPKDDIALTVRNGDDVRGSTIVELPELPDGSRTVDVDGTLYRVFTTTLENRGGQTVSLGLPAAEATETTQRQQRWVVVAGFLTIAAAASLGWLFGGLAVRPIAELTRRVNARPPEPMPKVTGVREAAELAHAIDGMLTRVADAQAETSAALTTARDFAAASAHELRTPLTAMRTDIEVLRTLDLDDDQRVEILGDLQRAQGRVEATLSALERLASGELASDRDYIDTDIVELCDLAAHDAHRHFPQVTVRVDADQSLITRGLPAGLRLALDNALSNAVRHGGATQVIISAQRSEDNTIKVAVDDNGAGIPESEHEAVFDRFYRGSTATMSGSGLGLALVAQQAQLHGGRTFFETSTLGGARLVIELADESG